MTVVGAAKTLRMKTLFFILEVFSFTLIARVLMEWIFARIRRHTGGEVPEFFLESSWWIALAIGASLAVAL